MTIRKIIAGVIAASVGFSSLALAQPGPPRNDHRGPGAGPAQRPHGPGAMQGPHRPGAMQGPRHPGAMQGPRGPGPGPRGYMVPRQDFQPFPEYRRYQRGDRLPAPYRSSQYVVNDWRAHHLTAPPRGHYWVQNGSDYVLAAIATGIIAAVILDAANR
jgi:Ni/Co efflux regulator RcnB